MSSTPRLVNRSRSGSLVGGPIVDEPVRQTSDDRLLQQRLDQSDFAGTGAIDVDGERQSGAVDQEHELRALAALGRAVVIAPFLAAANVPSAKPSSHSTSPCRSSFKISRRHAVPHALVRPLLEASPTSDVRRERAWQILPGGAVCKIQRMPSTQRRAFGPRPTAARLCGSLNRSAIKDHCSSLSSGRVGQPSGSILDPASKRDRSVISGLLFH